MKKPNILLVDDEDFVLTGLKKLLQRSFDNIGEIFTASSPIHALDILKEQDVSIIFTDIKMPGMSGIEFVELLNKQNKSYKTVILSGYADFSYAQTAMRNHVEDYLLKPITKEQLIKTMDKILTALNAPSSKDLLNSSAMIKENFLQILYKESYPETQDFLDALKLDISQNQIPFDFAKTFCVDLLSEIFVFAHERAVDVRALRSHDTPPTVLLSTAEDIDTMFIVLSDVLKKLYCFGKEKRSSDADVVEQIKAYALANIAQDIGLEQLAKVVFLTPNYISKLFKKETGIAFKDYILEIKIEKAKELLCQGNLKAYEISNLLGYKTSTHFSKVFKKKTGVYPSEYHGE